MSFSGFDIASISTLIHVSGHDHNHTDDQFHTHSENQYMTENFSPYDAEQNESRSVQFNAITLKLIHHHSPDDSDEPHEHTLSLSASMVALHKEPMLTPLDLVIPSKDIPLYIQDRVLSPVLDSLFRPPKC